MNNGIVMKIFEIIEARKNPAHNVKMSINQVIANRLAATTDEVADTPNLFISFTSVDKLGINPKSEYATPLGIYAYPADYVNASASDHREMSKAVPFAGEQPFANLFSVKGNIVNLTKMNLDSFQEYIRKLKGVIPKLLAISRDESDALIDRLQAEAPTAAHIPTKIGGRFWYITYKLANFSGAESKSPVLWNSIFRSIGISGFVDFAGIIHPNERTQAVFFSINSITNVFRALNKYSPESAADSETSRNEWVTKAATVDAMTSEFDAGDFIKYHGEEIIKFMRNKSLRNRVIEYMPELSAMLTNPLPFDVQRRILARTLTNIFFLRNADQQVVLSVLTAGEGGFLSPHLISGIRRKFPKMIPQLAAILNKHEQEHN